MKILYKKVFAFLKEELNLLIPQLNLDIKLILTLFLIFFSHFLSRIFEITQPSLWLDEVHSVFYAQQNISVVKATGKWDINPPGYMLVLHYWVKYFGVSVLSIRSMSLFFGALSGVILFLFSKRFLNLRTAYIVSVFYILSYQIFYYSLEARTYTFNIFLVLWTSYLLFSIIEKPSWLKSLLIGILFGYMFYTHYLLGFVIVIQGLFMIIYSFKNIKYLLAVATGSLIILIDWIDRIIQIFIKKTGTTSHQTWIPNPKIADLKNAFLNVFNNSTTLMYVFIVILTLTLSLLIIQRKKIIDINFKMSSFLLIMGPGVIFLHFFMSEVTPMWLFRYFIHMLPFLLLFIFYLISLLPFRSIYIYISLLPVAFYMFYVTDYHKPSNMNYQKAVEYLKGNRTDESVVIQQPAYFGNFFTYYYNIEYFKKYNDYKKLIKSESIYLLDDSTGLNTIIQNKPKEIFLLTSLLEWTDPKRTILNTLQTEYNMVEFRTDFQGLSYRRFKIKD